jgi:hypothetical protein
MTKHHKKTTLPIGTISSGTLRLEDLIPALASELDALRLTRSERKTVREALAFDPDVENDDPEEAQYLYDALCGIAENHCPDYAYFGSTEGDGAEIGVWPSIDSIKEDSKYDDGTVRKINAGDAFPKTSAYAYVMSVTDHGNVTLYRRSGRRWIEVWSVV